MLAALAPRRAGPLGPPASAVGPLPSRLPLAPFRGLRCVCGASRPWRPSALRLGRAFAPPPLRASGCGPLRVARFVPRSLPWPLGPPPLRLGRLRGSPGVGRCGVPRPPVGPLPGRRPRGLPGGLRCGPLSAGCGLPLVALAPLRVALCARARRPGSPSPCRWPLAGPRSLRARPRCLAGGGWPPTGGLFRLRRPRSLGLGVRAGGCAAALS